MKNVLSLAACLALAHASPMSLARRDISVTFNGAAGAGYTINVPLDGSSTPTSQSLTCLLSLRQLNRWLP